MESAKSLPPGGTLDPATSHAVRRLLEFSGDELVQFFDAVVRMIANRFRSIVVLDEAGLFQFREMVVIQIEKKSFGTLRFN
ncbi:hypothetical protein NGM15_01520 [Natronosalvus halobius]|nr:hypothetical protein [Natronosalvus halobius]USZ72015.1 hypothetical protein NGM15_01520 [Natronosalvus halobius]